MCLFTWQMAVGHLIGKNDIWDIFFELLQICCLKKTFTSLKMWVSVWWYFPIPLGQGSVGIYHRKTSKQTYPNMLDVPFGFFSFAPTFFTYNIHTFFFQLRKKNQCDLLFFGNCPQKGFSLIFLHTSLWL